MTETVRADLITNGDFESGTSPWTLITANVDTYISPDGFPGSSNIAMEIKDIGLGRQTTIDTIVADQKYTLSWDAASWDTYGDSFKTTLFYTDGSSVRHDLATQTVNFSDNLVWHNRSLDWTSQAGQDYVGKPLTVEFAGIAGSAWSNVDNVTLTASAIPEPSALMLGAISMLGLLCYAWRKRK
jgi:hypothetical protein